MSYNKDTDYSELIKESADKGDYQSAAKYEAARNEKITGENLDYKKTNDYSGWLDKTDYGTVIENKIKSGASKASVADSLKKRVSKASGTKGLEQYAYDDIYDSAIKYIMNGNTFNYSEKKPKYNDKYEKYITGAANKINRMEDFSYDPLSDELYELYKEEYRRAGSRAMEDTLGKIAANTGGVASSYAASAAGQTYDYYNSLTADKIPELYKLAYSKYLDDVESQYDKLAMFADLSNEDYSRYRDRMSDYEKDRKFGYDAYLSAIDNDYRQQALERNIFESDRDYDRSVYRDDRDYDRSVYEDNRDYDYELKLLEEEAAENERKWKQQDLENQQKEKQNQIDTAIKKWSELGYLDADSAKVLGLPEGLTTSDYNYKKAQTQKLLSK